MLKRITQIIMVVSAAMLQAVPLDAATNAEAAQRRRDMAGYRVYLQQRLQTVPEPATMKKLKSRLTEVEENRRMTGTKEVPVVMTGDMVINNREMTEASFKGLVALKKALTVQGSDLIVIPVPTHDMVYSQRLLAEIPDDADVNPNHTRALIKLIDAGVEVIDLREAFCNHDGSRFAMEYADHHWSSQGMAVAAELLYERLKRYEQIRQHRSARRDWSMTTVDIPTPVGGMRWSGVWNQKRHRKDTDLFQDDTPRRAMEHIGLPLTEPVTCFKYAGSYDKAGVQGHIPFRRGQEMPGDDLSPDVVVLGDSMLNHLGPAMFRGSPGTRGNDGSFQRHVGHQVGVPVGWLMRIAGGHRIGGQYIVETLNMKTRPRVVVLVGFTKTVLYSSAFHVPSVEVAKALGEDPRSGMRGTLAARLSQVAEIPDPAKTDYKDATVAAVATIFDHNSPYHGKKVKVVTWAFRDRTLTPGIGNWGRAARSNKTVWLNLMPWDEAKKKYPKLDTYQALDEVEDLELPQVWVEPAK